MTRSQQFSRGHAHPGRAAAPLSLASAETGASRNCPGTGVRGPVGRAGAGAWEGSRRPRRPAPHRARQLREVLARPLHDEAQLEDGAVEVGDLVEGAAFQVAVGAGLDVAPEDGPRPRWAGRQAPSSRPRAPRAPPGSYLENWNLG